MFKVSPRTLMIVLAACVPVVGSAGNLSFLKNSPISYFNAEDISLMMKAAEAALNDQDEQAKRAWQNPATGNSGEIQVLRSFKRADGALCRKLQVSNLAKKTVEGRASYPVCKGSDGTWAIDPNAKAGG